MNHANKNPALGFGLALLASMTWGSLPLAVQQVIKVIDAQTLVWSRFMVASVVLFVVLAMRGKLPKPAQFSRRVGALWAMGVFGLSANFLLFSQSLHYISPTTTQVLWQLAPFGMMICGVLLFRESMDTVQKGGAILLIIGLILFFNQNFAEILTFGAYALGIGLAIGASLIWLLYGLAQKLLLPLFSSQQILLMIYAGCALLLSPSASPSHLADLNGFTLMCFVYCCVNTLIAYGAYGEALNHWDASKVSVMTTMLPIFTMMFTGVAHAIAPDVFVALNMNAMSYLGACVVVFGAILAATGGKLGRKKGRF